tara:strand:+ start:23 stop:184 length:162 start_codon:yes stop_codon:yes gene_type:complete
VKNNSDYYLENGKMVLTEKFLIKRGFCCGSGCRNCPYIPSHNKGNKNLRNENK